METELSVVREAINDMIDRGFRRVEIEDVLRKVRRRHVHALSPSAKQ
ncbi:hypothetical protein M2171_002442 [Bradyrhizobium japonicum USDA 38]|nr:hypothetical protein [Bradyrhizobium japonicum]MCS3893309.1 hypothetical protein [Bradyrhizobium japonicum USDA 38]MCS3945823.1 hypothetical protein [Bradyrhizobium japonicum]